MIAGHEIDIPFIVTNDDGSPCALSVSGVLIEWRLSQFNYESRPIIKKDSISGGISIETSVPNMCYVHLLKEDTDDLSGIFTAQLTIKDSRGHQYRPYRGQIVIHPRIPLI